MAKEASYTECRIIILMVGGFFMLIITLGLFNSLWTNYVPPDDEADFWDESRLRYVSYTAINVSAAVEPALLRRVRDPCETPYELACGGWRANGSYLHDNAVLLHAARLRRAATHSAAGGGGSGASSSHPIFAQCMRQMVAPYDSASIGVIQRVLDACEPPAAVSDALDRNLARLQCYAAQYAIFPFFLWSNNSAPSVEPGMWFSEWPPSLAHAACALSAENGDANECVIAVETLQAAARHGPSRATPTTYASSQWSDATRRRLPLAGDSMSVWSDHHFQLLLRTLNIRSAGIFVRAAAAADMLLYVGLPAHHLAYGATMFGADAAARHALSSLERAHPPSIYGYGALAAAAFLQPHDVEAGDGLHPSAADSCILALGDVAPHVVANVLRPSNATLALVHATFAAVRAQLAAKIVSSTVLKESFRTTIGQRIADMALWIDAEEIADTVTVGCCFLETALSARRFHYERASDVGSRAVVGNFNFHAETLNAVYYPAHNAIYVPPGLLHPPFLPRAPALTMRAEDASVAPEILFGRIGVILAHEAAHVLDRFQLQRDRRASGEDFRLLSNTMACYANAIGNFAERETYADIAGFEASYRACMAADGCATAAARNTFFYVFAQTMCSNRPHAAIDTHQQAAERVSAAARMATAADGHGFAATQWACYEPPTCSF